MPRTFIPHPSKDSKWPSWLTVTAIMIFGLVLLLWPHLTEHLIVNVSGCALIAIGAIRLIRYFMHKSPFEAYDWNLAIGLTSLIAGILLMIFWEPFTQLILIILGILIVIGGISKLQVSLNLRRVLYKNWFLPLIYAGLSVLLGVLIIVKPTAIKDVLYRFIGASILIETILDFFTMRRYDKVIETYYAE